LQFAPIPECPRHVSRPIGNSCESVFRRFRRSFLTRDKKHVGASSSSSPPTFAIAILVSHTLAPFFDSAGGVRRGTFHSPKSGRSTSPHTSSNSAPRTVGRR